MSRQDANSYSEKPQVELESRLEELKKEGSNGSLEQREFWRAGQKTLRFFGGL